MKLNANIKTVIIILVTFTATFAIAYVISQLGLAAVYQYENIYSDDEAMAYVCQSTDLQKVCLRMAGLISAVPAVIAFIALKQKRSKKTPIQETKRKPSYAEIQRQKEQADEKEYQQVLDKLPYKRGWLLTIPEKKLWDILKEIIPKDQYIVIKPCLKEFIKVEGYTESAVNRRAWREIAQKHVDFLVCRKFDMRPLYAIEYDGQSHDPSNPANAVTIKSDKLKNEIFIEIEMPLIRLKYKESEDALRASVEKHLGEEAQKSLSKGEEPPIKGAVIDLSHMTSDELRNLI